MSIKNEMHCINVELSSIKESRGRIKLYVAELNKLNPLTIGQELTVNGCSHYGKVLVAEKFFVSDSMGNDAEFTAKEPVCFTAIGRVKKQCGELGVYSGAHSIKITDLL